MTHLEFRKTWIEYMESKGHKLIPNLPLPSYSDPTLLFVNSGMFPIVPYLEGTKHPLGKRVFNIQRCLRPGELELIGAGGIGDNRHTSVFEMLGNWSFGDYYKETQFEQLFNFLINELGLDPNRIYASVFVGDEDAPRDDDSIEMIQKIFKQHGITAEVAPDNYNELCQDQELDLSRFKIFPFEKSENWWQRGDAIGELGGPDSELFYDLQIEHDSKQWGYPHPATDSGRFIEIGNSVFMQFKKSESGWETLSQKNVDFGGGLERLVMLSQNKTDIFSTDLYAKTITVLEKISGVKYEPNEANLSKETIAFRVIADHMKAAVFAIGDGVQPSNKEQGYIIRKAIRRALRYAMNVNIDGKFVEMVANAIIETYTEVYPHLLENKQNIVNSLLDEESKFNKTLTGSMKEFEKLDLNADQDKLGEISFNMLQTYGFPKEMFIEELVTRNIEFDQDEFEKSYKEVQEKHKDLSRAGAEQRFKGGLADTKEVTVRYHTIAHLLLASIQEILGKDIHQKGQNITDQRLRYDFNFDRKLEDGELEQIENLVNEKINEGLTVEIEEHDKSEVAELGAEASFLERYPDRITVYKMWNPETKEVFSYEVCGGPHVENTKDILKSGVFKIEKEQSSGAGIRRVRGVLV